MRRPLTSRVIEKRNRDIAKAFNGGISTTQLGLIYGLSRERVCQVVYNMTGKSPREIKLERRMETAVRQIELSRRYCIICGVRLFDNHWKFCTRAHQDQFFAKRRRKDVILTCNGCGIKYHPLYTAKYSKKEKHNFHNRECFHKNLWKIKGGEI